MSLNPLDDLGKMVLYCPYCGAENIIFVSYADGGSDECWYCGESIHLSIRGRKIFIDQYTNNKGNIIERDR